MEQILKFSRNITEELEELVSAEKPVFSSDKGDLFVSEAAPVGAIRLKVPLTEYLAFIESLDESERPKKFHLVPIEDEPFQIMVNAPVKLEDGVISIDGRVVRIL